jgi:hypothetical protein
MDCQLKVERPGDIEFTLTVTMKADHWEKLREQLDKSPLSTSYPAYDLRHHIDDLLAQTRKVYWPASIVTKEPEAVS